MSGSPARSFGDFPQAAGETGPRIPPAHPEKILTTRVGLRFPPSVSFGDWERAGPMIARIRDASAWCLGDWLVYGQDWYAERYRDAVVAAGLDYQTLRNYAWVARRVERSRRRESLSFQHHAEVASLPGEEQDRWLRRAVEMSWSRNELRRQVQSARRESAEVPLRTTVLPPMVVPADHAQRWRLAAEHRSSELREWVVATLDAAARRILDNGPSAYDNPGGTRAVPRPPAPVDTLDRAGVRGGVDNRLDRDGAGHGEIQPGITLG